MSRLRVVLRLAVAPLVLGVTCLLLSVAFETGAARAAAEEVKVRYGGVYRAPLLNNPTTLDPTHVENIYGVTVVQQLFDGLVQFSPDLFVTPALAESWKMEDGGRAYRFVLRNNALFHHGRKVSSLDVVFSLKRLLRIEPPPTILPHLLKVAGAKDYNERKSEDVPGLQAIDERTLFVRLDEPYVPFIVALGMYQAKIVPREIVEADPLKFGSEPIGSGPFRFVSWEENKEIRLRSFSEYYGGRPRLDEIEYTIYPGISVEKVWADFQSGKLDQMHVYGTVQEKLKERKDIQWVHRPSLSLQFYGFNCKHPLLQNPDLRMALSLAIDRERLIADVYSGQFEAARGILSPGLPGYQPQELKMGEDLNGALKLMETVHAGAAPPITVEIVSNSQSSFARAELEFVRKSWARLGVELQTRFIPDWTQFKEYLRSDSVQIYRHAWFADIPDPDDMLRPLFSTGAQFNFMRYHDPEVDSMLQQALGIVNPVERALVYQQIEKRILQSCPLIPMIHLSVDYAYQSRVQGIEANALGPHTLPFGRVWLKDAPRQ